jgi:hypothetical protein
MRRLLAVSACAVGLAISGCSAPDAAPDASPGIDCASAATAMDDYSTSLADLATSLEAGDSMSAVAAADGMSYALDQLETALPAMPEAGDAFLDASRGVALQVKQSVADSPSMTGLLAQLTQSFSDPAFAQGGDAIDTYVAQECPQATEDPAP